MSAINPKGRKTPFPIALLFLVVLVVAVVIAISSSSSSFFSFGQQTGTGTGMGTTTTTAAAATVTAKAKVVADNLAVSSSSSQQQLLASPAASALGGDPWLNGFGYRKPISLSGSGTTLTDFQVNVTPYIYNETGLVGSWHFSESSGNATADSSGQGNTGYQYGTNRTTDGRFGNAMQFDGVDDYFDAGNAVSLDYTFDGSYTIEMWVKTSSVTTTNGLFEKRDTATGSMMAFFNYPSVGKVKFYSGSNVDGDALNSITSNLNNGLWRHLVFQLDGTTQRIYVDGVLDNSRTKVSGTNSDGNLHIGSLSTTYFNGTIDEVRIYNRTLSASEIQQHYNATKARLDYADIRFTDSDGSTLLPFWMESDGKFWVEVPSIPTAGTTIYAYYGNPAANDAQNGTGTFLFFDDFSGDLSKWTTAGTPTISSGTLTLNAVGEAVRSINSYTPVGSSLVMKYKPTGHGANLGLTITDVNTNPLGGGVEEYAGWQFHTDGTIYITTILNDGPTQQPNMGEYTHDYQVYTVNLVSAGATDFYTDTTLLGTNTNTPDSPLYVMLWNNAATSEVDYIFVRKNSSPAPSATQGTEESLTTMSGSAQNWNWQPLNSSSIGGTGKIRSGSAQNWNWVSFQQYLGRYRKPMTIAGSTSLLTDYQVNVTPYIYNETGLVGSWHFGESGGNATDSSGFGNTGTLYGTNRTTDGKFGNAMKFDGTDDYVDAGAAAILTMPTAFTYEAWFKTNDVSTYRIFLALGVGGATVNTGDVRIQANNVDAYWHGSGAGTGGILGSTALATGTWYHVAVVFASGQYPVLYLNGVSEGATTGAGQTFAGTGWKAWVGKGLYADAAQPFNGTIDEVKIYNRALSLSEIQQHYLASKARLDYADVRFTDSDGATLLPFWMESDGKFWVKVPSIPTTGTTIYAYYGNPQANDAQNGTGTFLFFDDFSADLGKWTVTQTVGSVRISDGGLFQSGGGTWNQNGIASTYNITRPAIIEWNSKRDGAAYIMAGYYDNSLGCPGGACASDSIYLYNNNNAWQSVINNGNTDLSTASTDLQRYKLKFALDSSTGVSLYIDDVLKQATTNNKNNAKFVTNKEVGNFYIDDVRVRKYASPEPSATQGTEEDSLIPHNITVPLGGATNWTWYPS